MMRHVRESPESGSEAKGAKLMSWSEAESEAEMSGMAAGMRGGSFLAKTGMEKNRSSTLPRESETRMLSGLWPTLEARGVPERMPLERESHGDWLEMVMERTASGSGWVISGFHDHGEPLRAGGVDRETMVGRVMAMGPTQPMEVWVLAKLLGMARRDSEERSA
jgi:hypothetical protein